MLQQYEKDKMELKQKISQCGPGRIKTEYQDHLDNLIVLEETNTEKLLKY